MKHTDARSKISYAQDLLKRRYLHNADLADHYEFLLKAHPTRVEYAVQYNIYSNIANEIDVILQALFYEK